jgi:hypothetical protein
VCGTTKLSGALWVGLGFKSEYLESPEVAAAAKSLIRPARYLLLANSLLATWEFVLWITCTAEELCSLSGSRALQVGIVSSLGCSALLFVSVVCVRTWRPLKIGPLYIAEWGLGAALVQMIYCAVYLMIAATTGAPPNIGDQPSVASQVGSCVLMIVYTVASIQRYCYCQCATSVQVHCTAVSGRRARAQA